MSHRLVYVIGPSGAGKDSVLQGLRQSWPQAEAAHWSRRTITRPLQAGGEQHEAVNALAFEQLCRQQAFAMHWQANGLSYGVRHEELLPLQAGRWVLVNGSRAWLPQLLLDWPRATLVHIDADRDILAQRLAARGRESVEAVTARLARQVPLVLPSGAIRIDNNGPLQQAVAELQAALEQRELDLPVRL